MLNVVDGGVAAHDKKVKMEFEIGLDYNIDSPHADFIFNIHAAKTDAQTVLIEQLNINQAINYHVQVDSASANRWLRLRAQSGPLSVRYSATVILAHVVTAPAHIEEMQISDLPPA